MSAEEEKFDYHQWWFESQDLSDPHFAAHFESIGVTPEMYIAWSRALRKPIYTWLELRWTSMTAERARELRIKEKIQEQLDCAKDAFCGLLEEYPELPTTAIRPLLNDVIGKYYSDHSNEHANPVGYLESLTGDIDRFIDIALTLYRDKAVQAAK